MPQQLFWCVEWHAELGSTMERASELAAAGAPSGTVVVADFQSQGRGTHGRVWHAQSGSCLMFTILLRPEIELERLTELPQRVTDALSDFVRDEFGLSPTVKMPNDILVDGKKLCGVLCSSRVTGERLDWVLCGVGLNTWMDVDGLPLNTATSLALEGVAEIPVHPELLEMVLGQLEWLREL
ncbi:hypothetical protein BH23CHL1_BH23CHL1_16520 [soil metagenome]